MTYKLINKTTGEEHICSKVVIDGFDYYVNDVEIQEKDHHSFFYHKQEGIVFINFIKGQSCLCNEKHVDFFKGSLQKIIATNNSSISLSQIIDEIEELANNNINSYYGEKNAEIGSGARSYWETQIIGFIEGYNKSQETHPYSSEDMIEFVNWIQESWFSGNAVSLWWKPDFENKRQITIKELLEIWKEQRIKVIYYT